MSRVLCCVLFVLLLVGCASMPQETSTSPLPQPAPDAAEQRTAPSPLHLPEATREMVAVDSPFAESVESLAPTPTAIVFMPVVGGQRPSIEQPDPSIRLDESPAIFNPLLSPKAIESLQLQLSTPSQLPSVTNSYRLLLPLVISIDQRVLDVRAQFDCSQAEVLDARQCDALLILYAVTNGPAWANSDGWLVNKNPCTWYGLKCPEPDYDKMKLLLLSNNNLDGWLPYEIYQLPLTFLRVPGNHLTGGIPPSIELMTDLEEMRLESNQFSGQVPLGIANLPRLRMLWLSGDDKSTLCTPEELRSFVEQLGTGYTPPSGGYCP